MDLHRDKMIQAMCPTQPTHHLPRNQTIHHIVRNTLVASKPPNPNPKHVPGLATHSSPLQFTALATPEAQASRQPCAPPPNTKVQEIQALHHHPPTPSLRHGGEEGTKHAKMASDTMMHTRTQDSPSADFPTYIHSLSPSNPHAISHHKLKIPCPVASPMT